MTSLKGHAADVSDPGGLPTMVVDEADASFSAGRCSEWRSTEASAARIWDAATYSDTCVRSFFVSGLLAATDRIATRRLLWRCFLQLWDHVQRYGQDRALLIPDKGAFKAQWLYVLKCCKPKNFDRMPHRAIFWRMPDYPTKYRKNAGNSGECADELGIIDHNVMAETLVQRNEETSESKEKTTGLLFNVKESFSMW